MKKILLFSLLSVIFHLSGIAQQIPPAPPDKAVVYFVRTSSLGFAINFSYFDSAQLIGKFNAPKYLRYECAPGAHLFWARSENRDFVEAELDAGKIYFILAVPQMGGFKAAVALEPVDPSDKKKMDKIFKLMESRTPESFAAEMLAVEAKEMEEPMKRGLEKYQEDKAKGIKMTRLEKTMFYPVQ